MVKKIVNQKSSKMSTLVKSKSNLTNKCNPFLIRFFQFLGIDPSNHISLDYTEKKERGKKIARGYKVTSSEPQEVPDSAPPATEDIHDDQSSEVASAGV